MLTGKVQTGKDTTFGDVIIPHKNPPATIDTKIRYYRNHSLTDAYEGKTFWIGQQPQLGDKILFKFKEPTLLSGFKFVSGDVEHPSFIFEETTTIEFLPNDPDADLTSLKLQKTSDEFYVVGHFNHIGMAEGDINANIIGKIKVSILVSFYLNGLGNILVYLFDCFFNNIHKVVM